jgi:hypothetical protein
VAVQIFVVVAKNRPDLYEYFRSGFAGVEEIEVIVDRRLRADDEIGAALPSRHSERRAEPNIPDIYDQLEQRGFVIVRFAA